MSKKKNEIIDVTIESLIPDTKNANKGNEYGEGLIEKSFRKFGAGRSILIDKDNNVIAGNKSLQKFSEIGLTNVRIIETDGTELIAVKRTDISIDSKKGRELAIADNASAKANITWDVDVVGDLKDEFEIDMSEWGIDFGEEVLEAQEDDFDAPPIEEIKTDIVLGDIFDIGSHRLICADSTDSDAIAKLMKGELADMVFTSPPYNANTQIGFTKKDGKGLKTSDLYKNNNLDNKTKEDYLQFNVDIFNTIKPISHDETVILYNIDYNSNSPSDYIDVIKKALDTFKLIETIVWKKSMVISLQGDNLTRNFEFIFVLFNGKNKPKLNKSHFHESISNVWEISNVGSQNEHHKACFPIKLVEQGINVYAKVNALIYEPFCGSGTTMVASHQLNRRCFGSEIDPKYCEVIVQRMIKLDNGLIIKRNGIDETDKWLSKLVTV